MRVDVAVVGGGVMGLAAAWRCALAGRSVLLLERGRFDHAEGSSHGATRIFRFAYDDPMYVRMAQAALPLWRELEERDGDVLTTTGGLDVGDPAYLDRCAAAQRAAGVTSERLSPGALAERFPWLRADPAEPALLSPDTGVIAAAVARARMAERAAALGAVLWHETPAEAIEPADDGVHIATHRGGVRARAAILAAGAWTRSLVAPLGIDLPLQVTREQVFYFAGHEPSVPWIHRRTPFLYGVPALYDAPGVKVGEHLARIETTASARSFEIERAGADRVLGYVREALPLLDPHPLAAETCLYTNTPDEHFVIEARGPLVLASPCSGHGFKFAPLVGEALARLTAGEAPPFDVVPFASARFTAG